MNSRFVPERIEAGLRGVRDFGESCAKASSGGVDVKKASSRNIQGVFVKIIAAANQRGGSTTTS
jgi:hypothetical protein